ncbi:hypothetical protein GC167_07225 [bacterium]|nr:hypothetical protein [bacterium]
MQTLRYTSLWWSNEVARPYIVLGMHRSGTSWLSRTLHDSGIFMGMFQEKNAESIPFLSLNQKALQARGGDWIDPLVLDAGTFAQWSPVDLYRKHLKLGMNARLWIRLCANYRWGWKDPRNVFSAPAWKERFPQARWIHVHRDGREVAMSLWNRNRKPGEVFDPRLKDLVFCFRLWERYLAQMEQWEQQGFRFATVSYAALLEGSGWKDLERALGVGLQPAPLRKRDASNPPAEFPEPLETAAQGSPVYQRWKAR